MGSERARPASNIESRTKEPMLVFDAYERDLSTGLDTRCLTHESTHESYSLSLWLGHMAQTVMLESRVVIFSKQ